MPLAKVAVYLIETLRKTIGISGTIFIIPIMSAVLKVDDFPFLSQLATVFILI